MTLLLRVDEKLLSGLNIIHVYLGMDRMEGFSKGIGKTIRTDFNVVICMDVFTSARISNHQVMLFY